MLDFRGAGRRRLGRLHRAALPGGRRSRGRPGTVPAIAAVAARRHRGRRFAGTSAAAARRPRQRRGRLRQVGGVPAPPLPPHGTTLGRPFRLERRPRPPVAAPLGRRRRAR